MRLLSKHMIKNKYTVIKKCQSDGSNVPSQRILSPFLKMWYACCHAKEAHLEGISNQSICLMYQLM